MRRNQRFNIRIFMYTLPFLLLLGGVVYLGWQTGDVIPYPLVYQMQLDDERLVYYPQGEQNDLLNYKFNGMIVQQPDITIIGSSRVYPFREAFFREDARFYNSGVSQMSFVQSDQFLRRLIQHDVTPDVVILSIDLPDFSGFVEHEHLNVFDVQAVTSQTLFNLFTARMSATTHHLWTTGATVQARSEWLENDSIVLWGTTSQERQRGYRVDGSMYLPIPDDLELWMPTVTEEARTLSTKYLADLESLLSLATEHDIIVVGLLLPWHPTYYEQIRVSEGHPYITDMPLLIEPIFAQYEFPLFDVSDPASIGSGANEFYDFWHGHELSTLRILQTLLTTEPELFAPYLDETSLERMIAQADDPFDVFDEIP